MEDKFLDAKPSFPSREDSNEDKFSNLIFQMVMLREWMGPTSNHSSPIQVTYRYPVKFSIIQRIILIYFNAISMREHVF